jgi:hypothetical protein
VAEVTAGRHLSVDVGFATGLEVERASPRASGAQDPTFVATGLVDDCMDEMSKDQVHGSSPVASNPLSVRHGGVSAR